MTLRTSLHVSAGPMAICVLGFIGYAFYLSPQTAALQGQLSVTLTFWDALLLFLSEVRLMLYWTVPLMSWITLRQLQVSATRSAQIRYSTRADWTVSQVRQLSPVISALVGALLLVGLAGSLRFSFIWGWGQVSADTELLRSLPALTPLLPLPVLMVAMILLSCALTLAAIVAIIAASAASLQRPRLPAGVAIGLTVWGIIAFFVEGAVTDVLGLAAYFQPVAAAAAFGLGPGAAVTALLLAAVVAYNVARSVELRRRDLGNVSPALLAWVVGMLTLLGLAAMQSDSLDEATDQAAFLVMMLQGVGVDGFYVLAVIANTLLVLPPAVMLHRQLTASLEGLRYAEMVRVGSPARWYIGRLRSALASSAAFSAVMAVWALLLLMYFTHQLPGSRSLGLALVWALALLIQVVLLTAVLALGTMLARRVEGGAYAVAAILATSLPLGTISRWLPGGQPSLLRLLDSPATAEGLSLLPVLAQVGWLLVAIAATAAMFNRTRGEIY